MAAGQGFKTFATGDVLSAADVNGYLMQGVLVFADSAERDAEITSPEEGQCCYLKDTDAVLTYSGAGWVGFDDSNAIQNAIVDAKGDLIAASAADTPARLAVGADGETLVADSSTATGLKWASPSGPAFSAYLNGDQTLTSGVLTKIAYNAEDFDTDNCFDPTTNYRFTPTKAGYYQISISAIGTAAGNTRIFVRLYKNGSNYVGIFDDANPSVTMADSGAALVAMNGTTDYLEVYMFITGSSAISAPGANSTQNKFAGVWIRGL